MPMSLLTLHRCTRISFSQGLTSEYQAGKRCKQRHHPQDHGHAHPGHILPIRTCATEYKVSNHSTAPSNRTNCITQGTQYCLINNSKANIAARQPQYRLTGAKKVRPNNRKLINTGINLTKFISVPLCFKSELKVVLWKIVMQQVVHRPNAGPTRSIS